MTWTSRLTSALLHGLHGHSDHADPSKAYDASDKIKLDQAHAPTRPSTTSTTPQGAERLTTVVSGGNPNVVQYT